MVQQIFETVIRPAERGVSIMLVEKHVDPFFEIAGFVYALERGRVPCAGPAGALRRDPGVRDLCLPDAA